ncbi:hypothetical protein F4819DRAFT_473162 [Hypoxylon fuscum]|nr:hypothetical protein F4819DRAFT_473162 [Hypoxylon fuscum]
MENQEQTQLHESSENWLGARRDGAPYAGGVFFIRERSTGRVVTAIDSYVFLQEAIEQPGFQYWVCEQAVNWLSFYNPVSGRYIGHDGNGNIRAQHSEAGLSECFSIQKHYQGGFTILMNHNRELRKIATGEDNCSLVATIGDGTLWDFEAVVDGYHGFWNASYGHNASPEPNYFDESARSHEGEELELCDQLARLSGTLDTNHQSGI